MLSQCLLDVNAAHEVFVYVSLFVLTLFCVGGPSETCCCEADEKKSLPVKSL